MAVLKSKNKQGEWVNIANADSMYITNMVGELKMAFVKPFNNSTITSNPTAYDLSPYVNSGDDFMIFFCANVSSGGSVIHMWMKSDGVLRKTHEGIENNIQSLEELFKTDKFRSVSYDEESCVLSITPDRASDQVYEAVLFYADAKEA